MKIPAVLAAAILLLAPGAAHAQQMKLQIQNGLVTLDASNVPVRQILAEWARIGGAKVVNGEKVAGGPVTLQLLDVPERQALDTILRGVSGYMLAARADLSTGVSAFDRILILPTSSAPRHAPAPPITGFPGRQMPQQPPVMAEPAEETPLDIVEEDGDNDVPDEEGGGEVPPQPDPQYPRRQIAFPNPNGPQPQPFVPQNVPGMPQPVDQEGEGTEPAVTNSPFGVPAGASTVPGVVSPVPQPPENQGQPGSQVVRPPRPPL
jgi:hypothetical protein